MRKNVLNKLNFLLKSRSLVNSSALSTRHFSTKIKRDHKIPDDNLTLKDFLVVGKNLSKPNVKHEGTDENEDVLPPYLQNIDIDGHGRKVYFDVYGCQMNVNDIEIVWSILKSHNYQKTEDLKEADVILIMTCSIRDSAETKIWNRLTHLTGMKRKRPKNQPLNIGILGCMAERLKETLIEKERQIDLIAGPDTYKDLPRLLALSKNGYSTINVLLSLDETYSDVMPVKFDQNAVSAFVSIMRGCDNMCSYCIVPFTRGKERSRPIDSIVKEIRILHEEQGIKEVTLLGQNVNSFRDISKGIKDGPTELVSGFKTVYKTKVGGLRFGELLEEVANISPELRIRFTSPHPKDFPKSLLEVIKTYPNICKSLHIPAQSGSSSVLERMRRGYTREAYLELINDVRKIIPNVSLSSDFICGFCGETEDDFQQTLSLINEVKYNVAFLFPYSMRAKTTAYRKFTDDVPNDIKLERLHRMVEAFRENAQILNEKLIGTKQLILIEDTSKRSEKEVYGRCDGNIKVIIPSSDKYTIGDYVAVEIANASSQVLKGHPLEKISLKDYYSQC
ncbi:CDK5RAP1-like protein [Chironomus tepperi]|uniref:CDK5RAP1-like protein n=1 Tax=Chironomus tepperi TaxID=113505 RepID=UPI00391F7D88